MSVQFNVDGSNYNQDQRYQIEGEVYIFNTRWNYRSGWILSIYDNERNPLRVGMKMMPNQPLSLDFLTGLVVCADTDPIEGSEVIEVDTFGFDRRYQLIYFSQDELQTFATTGAL